jgi:EpsI family protein
MLNATARFCLAMLLLAPAAVLNYLRKDEPHPPRLLLQDFPEQLGTWSGADIPISDEELEKLGPSEHILRAYRSASEDPSLVNLFIVYFPSQRTGDTIHSPQHCIPGAGWTPIENTVTTLSLPGHEPFPVNRFVFSKGDDRALALYWYWAHDRGVASEYWAKYYLIRDAIKMNRSDGALVRIITTMNPGESAADAEKRLAPFTNSILPMLNEYIPR